MADIGEVLKKLFTTPTHRFIIGEAINDTTKNATVLYDDKIGSPSEGLTFTIPEDNNPPPPEECPPGQHRDPQTGQCVPDSPPPPPPPPEETIKAKVTNVIASKQDSGKEADKTIDGDFESRWSADGVGEWIEFTFDQPYKIKTVKLTGYHYDKAYTFEINGQNFICRAGRTPNTLVDFDLSSLNIDSNKVRIIGKGNNASTYNSYREIEFWGVPGTPPAPKAVIKPANPAGMPGQTIALDGSESTGKLPLKYFWTASITPNTLSILNPDSAITSVKISDNAQPGTSATVTLTVTDAEGIPVMDQKLVSIIGTPPPPPPPPPTGNLTRLVAFADNDTTSGAKDVLSAIMKVPDVSEYEFVGDGPYSSSGTKWVSMMKDYFNTPDKVAKLRVSQGNHDHKESESDQTEKDIEAWLPSLNKSPEALDWTSSGQVGNVYVISGNTQDLDVEFKRDQFNWLKGELEKAKQLRSSGVIDWIVYLAHKPFFTLKTSHSPYTAVRNNYKDIFRDAQVDFVLHGHNHNTQLWLPMVPNDSDANGEGSQLFTRLPDGTFDFTKDHGAAYIVTGHAGHEWNGINDSGSGVQNVMHYRDSGKFGFTQLDFEGKKATVKSIDSDGKVHFEYKVSRDGGTSPPPPPDQAVARLEVPSSAQPNQTHLRADASQSIADTVEITQTTSENINLRDTGQKWVKEFDIPDKNNFSIGFQAVAKKGTNQSIIQKSVQVSGSPPPPPPPAGETDEHGTPLIHKVTGKRVTMEKGSDHRNGQRYNVNHNYKNYMMYGYFKTGRGQEKIEMKTDGPNHGGCDKLPQCMWYEPSIVVDSGKIEFGGEWPHPDNHSGLRMDYHDDIIGGIKEQWLGYAVVAYDNPQGQRVIEQWDIKDPLDSSGKPKTGIRWHLNLRSTETGDGKMFPADRVPRTLPVDFDEGLEAEIRMHRGTNHDTEMKFCYVAEIVPPAL